MPKNTEKIMSQLTSLILLLFAQINPPLRVWLGRIESSGTERHILPQYQELANEN